LDVTATCVRVPIRNCHSVSIVAEFKKCVTIASVKKILSTAPGIELVDIPMPIHADGTDNTIVGRIRRVNRHTISLFCVADNLRKGAATNAVQILEKAIDEKT
jgi:aspartate-semialdehyde dehydrogenase